MMRSRFSAILSMSASLRVIIALILSLTRSLMESASAPRSTICVTRRCNVYSSKEWYSNPLPPSPLPASSPPDSSTSSPSASSSPSSSPPALFFEGGDAPALSPVAAATAALDDDPPPAPAPAPAPPTDAPALPSTPAPPSTGAASFDISARSSAICVRTERSLAGRARRSRRSTRRRNVTRASRVASDALGFRTGKLATATADSNALIW
mmetsp:Transcript_1156/g.4309  ORF Transcript_1156/g.4309 Transcript_1156/m.4309 type:complete len:210 (-) Transcript_1156:371-1000(-)